MSDQSARADGDRNIIVQATGSGHTINVGGFAHLTLSPASRQKVRTPTSDLDLLNPAMRAIPLTGRDQDQADLRTWLSTERAHSVRTIIGPGGSGKTRLAIETMLEVSEDPADPWDAGFLSHAELTRFVATHNVATWGWQKNTLMVVDYAASLASELSTFLSELSNVDQSPGNPRLRVLLLERHGSAESPWYSQLVSGDWESDGVRDLFDPREPVHISPLQETHDRLAILRASLDRAASFRAMSAPPLPPLRADPAFERCLAEPQWADPLMLMMAALTSLETGVPTALSFSRTDMAKRLARREQARIRKFAPQDKHYAAEFLVRLAATATLCGGLSFEEARNAASHDSKDSGIEYPEGPGAAVKAIYNAFPGTEGALEPIRPDLIGEAFLLESWKPKPPRGSIQRALAFANKNVIPVLIRTAQDFANDTEHRPIQWLEDLTSNTAEASLLDAVNDALPLNTLCLREFASKIAAAMVSRAEGEERCRLLVHLSNRQSALGQREQALASIEEAVRLYRDLAAARPDALRPNLAVSLNNLSNQQSDLGQREQALASIEEAVRLFRDLAAARPDAFRPNLAVSLNNLSNQQSDLGQREQAHASIEEAVRLYRDLAAARPDAFRPDLALSLNNLSNRQSALGQREQAHASIEEAVRLYRDLAAARPDAFHPDLALSLNNLSNRQSDLGQREQALASIEEAVRIRRDLAAARPDAFRPNLARSLAVLGRRHAEFDSFEAALLSVSEALVLLLPFFRALPAAFSGLARAMSSDYIVYIERLGREPDIEIVGPYLSYFDQLKKKYT